MTQEQVKQFILEARKQGQAQGRLSNEVDDEIYGFLESKNVFKELTKEKEIQKITEEGKKAEEFLAKPWYRQLGTKEFIKEIPGGVAETLIKQPIKFGISAAETPATLIKGRATQSEYKLPGMAPFKSFQSEAETRAGEIIEGKKPLYTALAPFAEVPLAAAETMGAIKIGKQAIGIGKQAIKKTGEILAKRGTEKAISKTIDIVRKPITPKLEAGYFERGLIKDVGIRGKRTALPDLEDIRVAESVSHLKLKSNKPIYNRNLIQQEVQRINIGVKDMVRKYKTPFNESQLTKQLEKAKAERIFEDSPTEKVYDKVVKAFKGFVAKKDTAGLLEARQAFDVKMKAEYGEKIFESGNPLAKAVQDVRQAANTYIANSLPKNNPYKSSLLQEHNMIKAIGNIAEKSKKTLGTTRFGRLLEKYPKTKSILKYGAGGTIGAGAVYGASKLLGK